MIFFLFHIEIEGKGGGGGKGYVGPLSNYWGATPLRPPPLFLRICDSTTGENHRYLGSVIFAFKNITTLNHKTCINTSGQGFKKTLFAINAIFSKDGTDSE